MHVPLWRRDWKDGPEIEMQSGGRIFALQMLRPRRIHAHLMDSEDGEEKVGDAYFPRLT